MSRHWQAPGMSHTQPFAFETRAVVSFRPSLEPRQQRRRFWRPFSCCRWPFLPQLR